MRLCGGLPLAPPPPGRVTFPGGRGLRPGPARGAQAGPGYSTRLPAALAGPGQPASEAALNSSYNLKLIDGPGRRPSPTDAIHHRRHPSPTVWRRHPSPTVCPPPKTPTVTQSRGRISRALRRECRAIAACCSPDDLVVGEAGDAIHHPRRYM